MDRRKLYWIFVIVEAVMIVLLAACVIYLLFAVKAVRELDYKRYLELLSELSKVHDRMAKLFFGVN